MEDDLNFFQIEDDLNSFLLILLWIEMEDSNFIRMKDDLKFFVQCITTFTFLSGRYNNKFMEDYLQLTYVNISIWKNSFNVTLCDLAS